MYRGVLKNLKKRWCVLHENTFMWFKGKQDFIKAGWLSKLGGGTSTLGRKNWKRRWMTLRGGTLIYQPSEVHFLYCFYTCFVFCKRLV
jgi:myosin X